MEKMENCYTFPPTRLQKIWLSDILQGKTLQAKKLPFQLTITYFIIILSNGLLQTEVQVGSAYNYTTAH